MRDYRIILTKELASKAIACGFPAKREDITAEEVIQWLAVEERILVIIGSNPPHTGFYPFIEGRGRRILDPYKDDAMEYSNAAMLGIERALNIVHEHMEIVKNIECRKKGKDGFKSVGRDFSALEKIAKVGNGEMVYHEGWWLQADKEV